ncbi:PREDICTED: uncharacterized protein LOC108372862, partial [Rhagoletis zephyria]|uniref:uncharacterized protein LOC108372862 n=1 Tax=Rhagoletis zephyria TaxID=28612 RepID=UPI000811684D
RQKYQSTQSAGNNDFDLSNEYSGSGDDAIAGHKSENGGQLGFEQVGYECSYEVAIDWLHSIQIVGAELSRPTQPMKLLEKQSTENTKEADGLEIKSYRMTAT